MASETVENSAEKRIGTAGREVNCRPPPPAAPERSTHVTQSGTPFFERRADMRPAVRWVAFLLGRWRSQLSEAIDAIDGAAVGERLALAVCSHSMRMHSAPVAGACCATMLLLRSVPGTPSRMTLSLVVSVVCLFCYPEKPFSLWRLFFLVNA